MHEPHTGKPVASRIGLAMQGADGHRYRSVHENEPGMLSFFKTTYQIQGLWFASALRLANRAAERKERAYNRFLD